ncbi:class D sortase, partial [Tyzzerella sp. OttesenSCG-928-J15]|nr:class D sortase [Tyzzerella sp. OttesenSCG-928-J15]
GITSIQNVNSTTTSTGASNVTISTGNYNSGNNTEVWEYSDGSIGRLYIPDIDINVKVFEGETLANMDKGAAHFKHTSAFDGNVCICAHNSGSSGYFKNLKKLEIGDRIEYETKYGNRTYVVSSMHVIADTDYSLLGYSSQNQLTLVTCENGVANQRYVVVAVEK